jgi:hypothetical protein
MYGQVLDEKIVNFFGLGLAASVQLFERQNDDAIGDGGRTAGEIPKMN